MFILDTDVLTLLLEGEPALLRHLEQARSTGEAVTTTIITRAEVMRGRFEYLLKASDREQFLRAQRLLLLSEDQFAALPILPLDATALDRFEALRHRKGVRSIGRADLLIGAIALARGATVVTRNVKDFSRIAALHLDNWMD